VQQQRKLRDAAEKYNYPYSTFIILRPTKRSGTVTNHLLKSRETRTQASRQKQWFFCVSARAHEYVGVITKLFLRHLNNQ